MPHAENASSDPARRPDEDDHASIEHPCRYKARLAIVATIVGPREVDAGEDLASAPHIQTALSKRLLTLCGVAGDAHQLIVATCIAVVKPRDDAELLSNFN